jgi:hypothetical protein
MANNDRDRDEHTSFQHTQLGVYLVGGLALLYICNDSAQVCGALGPCQQSGEHQLMTDKLLWCRAL